MSEYKSVSHPWKRKKNGKKSSCQEHRRVWMIAYGEIPKGKFIHHINRDKKDNRLENLKCVSRSEHRFIHLENPKIKQITN